MGDPLTASELADRYRPGQRVRGIVAYVAQFGVFLDLEWGGTGLMLVPDCGLLPRQMPSDVYSLGDAVAVDVDRVVAQRLEVKVKRATDINAPASDPAVSA